ncbi:MAG TPA: precorrin-2 C(20)-methyltransferase [Cyanothece sp. UBA12306]|nr:precorrin-2 C(20)-methyltransferase [Cyanothece sp. UBA12306]
MVETTGILYGISVGTGDPDLITVKGVRILQRVSVVAFPMGLGQQLGIAEQIISPWIKATQQKLPLFFPYVRDHEQLQQAWREAASQVWQYLQQGKNVAFACEGDVSFYSTFTYLAQTLKKLHPQLKIEMIPGVCSPLAVASVLKIPLTVSNQRLAVIPALYHLELLESVLTTADVVVLLKVSSVYSQVWQVLHNFRLLEQSWVVERATQPDQIIYANLSDRPHLDLSYFSLLIVQVNPSAPL